MFLQGKFKNSLSNREVRKIMGLKYRDYVPVKSKLQHPPHPPGAFEFLENFCLNSPLTGPKSCSNAPVPGKITRLLF